MAKAVAMLVAVGLVVVAAIGTSADDCKPELLSPCLPAIVSGSAPTEECCSNLRAQQGCLCQYAHNPAYSPYINSPNARHTLATCGISIPSC